MLLTVEGEKDDICAIGQTVAAHDLCSGLRPYLKRHHMQAGVGHYGVFSGKRWEEQIYPHPEERHPGERLMSPRASCERCGARTTNDKVPHRAAMLPPSTVVTSAVVLSASAWAGTPARRPRR